MKKERLNITINNKALIPHYIVAVSPDGEEIWGFLKSYMVDNYLPEDIPLTEDSWCFFYDFSLTRNQYINILIKNKTWLYNEARERAEELSKIWHQGVKLKDILDNLIPNFDTFYLSFIIEKEILEEERKDYPFELPEERDLDFINNFNI